MILLDFQKYNINKPKCQKGYSHMDRIARLVLIIIFMIIACMSAWASGERVGEGRVLYPKRVEQPPRIDGKLDEPAWKDGPIVSEPFITNNPVYGNVSPQKTEVWLTYDYDNVYIAFYCHDDESDKIKTSVTQRDNILNDDWIGIDFDTMGKRQFVYELYCNAHGIQADLLNSASAGETYEPDWVWYSAGKVVNDGYIVEIRIPLKSLKFKSGQNVRMNLAFCRFVSRTGTNASWPQISQKEGYFNSLVPVVFERLDKQLRLETLPSVTYGSIWDRQSPNKWSDADDSAEFGVGIKYGITSAINAEITINPDFSQVESDQFQVVANQRYPLFYVEKRPFFMELGNQFNLAGLSGDGNMSTVVHTRNIIDPAWGGKITGEWGKTSFGFLAAGDEWPGREWEDGTNFYPGQNANFFIGRFKYGLKGENYLGVIYSGREFADEFNRVIGGDFHFRLKGNHGISFNGLYTFSKDPESLEDSQGGALTLTYDYSQKPLDLFFSLEHYEHDFRMDSAYYFRTGIMRFIGYVGPNLYPNSKKIPWLKKIKPFIYGYYTHDWVTGRADVFFLTALQFFFSRQGVLRFDYRIINENWAGESFNQREFLMIGRSQVFNWLFLDVIFRAGKRLYYDLLDPFLGNQTNISIKAGLQPNAKLAQDFEYTYQQFDRISDGKLIYDLNMLASRTTYQFNKYLFLRALIQYDSYRSVVLTDMLASFTLIPGTVIHLGYGSLHREQHWNEVNSQWVEGVGLGKYYQTTRSIFFKASYLYRF